MGAIERIIPATIADDGSVHYTSVTSAPDDSTAVCYMVPSRVIPVIFVPGVMGTNLADKNSGKAVWLVDNSLSIAAAWMGRSPESRKGILDPENTVVYEDGKIPSGTAQSEAELRRRGWGTVGNMSYGKFLPMLENALNDASECEIGLRAQLMHKLVATAPGVSVLSNDEVDLSYKYQLPVHAVGYNWLQSNADSAKHLAKKIEDFKNHYKKLKKICEKVIIVTHSMGGLVARYYSEVNGHRDSVLGIVHGVMPTTGSATAYKRVKAGTEGISGTDLGPDAATMKWWGLVDDKLINPLDPTKKSIDTDWRNFANLVKYDVRRFHENMRGRFHPSTRMRSMATIHNIRRGVMLSGRERRRPEVFSPPRVRR